MPGFKDKRKAEKETMEGMFTSKNKSKRVVRMPSSGASKIKVSDEPKRFPKFGNKTFEELTDAEKKKAVFG